MANQTTTDDQLRAYGIFTHSIPMPGSIRGYVQQREDFYLVYLNDQLGDAARWSTMEHEIRHIVKNDFEREALVDLIEEENDK